MVSDAEKYRLPVHPMTKLRNICIDERSEHTISYKMLYLSTPFPSRYLALRVYYTQHSTAHSLIQSHWHTRFSVHLILTQLDGGGGGGGVLLPPPLLLPLLVKFHLIILFCVVPFACFSASSLRFYFKRTYTALPLLSTLVGFNIYFLLLLFFCLILSLVFRSPCTPLYVC